VQQPAPDGLGRQSRRRFVVRFHGDDFRFDRAAVRTMETVDRQIAARWMPLDNRLNRRPAAPRAGIVRVKDQGHGALHSRKGENETLKRVPVRLDRIMQVPNVLRWRPANAKFAPYVQPCVRFCT